MLLLLLLSRVSHTYLLHHTKVVIGLGAEAGEVLEDAGGGLLGEGVVRELHRGRVRAARAIRGLHLNK